MYGEQLITKNDFVAVDSYDIQDDQDGSFSFLFRIIDNCLKISHRQISSFSSLSDQPVHSLWLDAFLNSQTNQSFSCLPILKQLDLANLNQYQQIKQLISSLPPSIVTDLFTFDSYCKKCSVKDSFVSLPASLNLKFTCQKCQSQLELTKIPQILLTKQTQNIQLNQQVAQKELSLNAILCQKGFSVLVDFTNQEKFILNDSKQRLQQEQLTYLKPQNVFEYINSDMTILGSKLGKKVLCCFYTSRQFPAFQNVIEIEPVHSNQLQSDIKAEIPVPKPKLILKENPVLHVFEISKCAWILIIITAILMIIAIAFISVLYYQFNNVFYVNNLVTNSAFVGLGVNQTTVANLTAQVDSLVTTGKTGSNSFFIYSNYVQSKNLTSLNTKIITDTNEQFIKCGQTTMSISSLNVTPYQVSSATVQAASVSLTNSTNFVHPTPSIDGFPSIDKLNVDSLTVNSQLYSKQFSGTNLTTNSLTTINQTSTNQTISNNLNTSQLTIKNIITQQIIGNNVIIDNDLITQLNMKNGNMQVESISLLAGANLQINSSLSLNKLQLNGDQLQIENPLQVQKITAQLLNSTTIISNSLVGNSSSTNFVGNLQAGESIAQNLNGSISAVFSTIKDINSSFLNLTSSQLIVQSKLVIGDFTVTGDSVSHPQTIVLNAVSSDSQVNFDTIIATTTTNSSKNVITVSTLNDNTTNCQSAKVGTLNTIETNVTNNYSMQELTATTVNLMKNSTDTTGTQIWAGGKLSVDRIQTVEFCQNDNPSGCVC